MTTLELEVPESILEQLRVWVAAGKISSEREFLAELVVEAVERRAWLELRSLVEEGLRGPPVEMRAADWEALLERMFRLAGQ